MSATRRDIFRQAGVGVALGAGAVLPLPAFADTALPRPPILGGEKASKRLLIWGSYTCPFTAQLLGIVWRIVGEMGDAVAAEWHHFPAHAPDPGLHVAGLAFEGQHFWGFTARVLGHVYAEKGQFSGLTPDKVLEFATAEGGSAETLRAAYADKAKWAAVKQDFLAGQLLGMTATPGLFFNGYFLTPEGLPLDLASFDKSLRAMLKQA